LIDVVLQEEGGWESNSNRKEKEQEGEYGRVRHGKRKNNYKMRKRPPYV
jgi:hypothetical protein